MSQFIDGRLDESLSGRTDVVRDPSNGEVVAEVSLAGPEDVDRAVQAARAAYPDWAKAAPVDRSTVLTAFARLLQERAEEFGARNGVPGELLVRVKIDRVLAEKAVAE